MLENTIIIVVSVWLLLIPIGFEIVSFIKCSGVPRFFSIKPSTRYIILGMLVFLSVFTIDSNFDMVNDNKAIKYYNLFCIVITILWEIIKFLIAERYLKHSSNKECIKVCLAIDKYVGDYVGYNVLDNKMPKSIWCYLRNNNGDTKSFTENELSIMREYLISCRKHAIKCNDAFMLQSIIKMEFRFLNSDGSISEFYKECMNNPENKEQESIVKLVKSKQILFKFKKEIFL